MTPNQIEPMRLECWIQQKRVTLSQHENIHDKCMPVPQIDCLQMKETYRGKTVGLESGFEH